MLPSFEKKPSSYDHFDKTAATLAGTCAVTNGSAGAHTHNITGAPGLGTLATASQGGTEARPESAAVLICIRY